MAPSDCCSIEITQVNATPTTLSGYGVYRVASSYSSYKATISETKEAKKARIAREKMFASWKTYNDKTMTVKEIKQVCRPQHRVNYMGRRN